MISRSNAPTGLEVLGTARRVESMAWDFNESCLLAILRCGIALVNERSAGEAGVWEGA